MSGEGAFQRISAGLLVIFVGALSGNHHRAFHFAEVIAFHESRRTARVSNAIYRHAVVVIVIDVCCYEMQSWAARIGMVKPVVVVSDAQVLVFACSSAASHHLSIVKEMVKRNGNVGRAVFYVYRSVAFHLVSVLSRFAVEEVRVVYPYISVVCVQRHGIVAEEHYAQISNLHVLCPFHRNAEAVERSIVADALNCHILKTAVLVVESCQIKIIAVLDTHISGIGYSSHHSDDERSLVVTFAVGSQNLSKSGICSGFPFLVFHLTSDFVYVIVRHIQDAHTFFRCSVHLVRPRNITVSKGKALPDVSFHVHVVCSSRVDGLATFIQRLHGEAIFASLQPQRIGTHIVGVSAYELVVDFCFLSTRLFIIYIIACGTAYGLPFHICTLQTPGCLHDAHCICVVCAE